MVIADDSARADFVAADLLAQAEHSPDAQALLVTTVGGAGRGGGARGAAPERAAVARARYWRSRSQRCALIVVDTLETAFDDRE